MKDETVEKMRAGLEWVKENSRIVAWAAEAAYLDGLLALLPPKPEVPEGPLEVFQTVASADVWNVADANHNTIAHHMDKPVAELLASAPELRRRVDAAEGLLRRCPTFLDAHGWKTSVAKDIDRYFKESGP